MKLRQTFCIGLLIAAMGTSCSDNSAQACHEGSYQAQSACEACAPIDHCATVMCTSASDSQCLRCDDGYEADGDTCRLTAANFAMQAYVKAANADAGVHYASTVAISGDTMVIGTPEERSNQTDITNGTTASNDTSKPMAGAVYVYVRNGGQWTQQAYIKAPNASFATYFGSSVAISGDTIAVGSYWENSSYAGVVNGSTVPGDSAALRSGAVYVFTRSGTTWTHQAYLKAPNVDALDWFGSDVAIAGDTLVVGAPNESSNQATITNGLTASSDDSMDDAGAAYVYVRNGTTWSPQAYLKASNPGQGDHFGVSVAISGETIVVGADDEASSQTSVTNGATASSDDSAASAGAAYVFVRSGDTWTQQAYLKASNGQAEDFFGHTVAIFGNTIAIGATGEDSSYATISNSDNGASDAGAAYVFTRTGSQWAQQAYLKASNADSGDGFASSIEISGEMIAVGAPGEASSQRTSNHDGSASTDNSASYAGAAYIFVRNGLDWAQRTYLKAPNADPEDLFGGAVAISGDTFVAGASGEANPQTTISNDGTASDNNDSFEVGAAYVFVR